MKLMLEQPIQNEDMERIKSQLLEASRTVSMSKSVTIIEVGPCWIRLEDGMLKAGCDF